MKSKPMNLKLWNKDLKTNFSWLNSLLTTEKLSSTILPLPSISARDKETLLSTHSSVFSTRNLLISSLNSPTKVHSNISLNQLSWEFWTSLRVSPLKESMSACTTRLQILELRSRHFFSSDLKNSLENPSSLSPRQGHTHFSVTISMNEMITYSLIDSLDLWVSQYVADFS